jgi:hypothetical protein
VQSDVGVSCGARESSKISVDSKNSDACCKTLDNCEEFCDSFCGNSGPIRMDSQSHASKDDYGSRSDGEILPVKEANLSQNAGCASADMNVQEQLLPELRLGRGLE